MKYKSNREKILYFFIFSFIFICMYIFFSKIHKLVIYDADDWTYIGVSRRFIPIWHDWNPAKLFPECLMPLCGFISAYLIYPLTNNYVHSITIVTSFVVSFMITLYFYMFFRLIYKLFDLSKKQSLCITILFILVHFLLFDVSSQNNQYMFFAHNVNCYYNYLIPNLLNFIIVFYFMSTKNFDFSLKSKMNLRGGIFLLLIYIAIFSNLYCNIVLAIYAGVELLFRFINNQTKKEWKKFLSENIILIIILISWICSFIYEINGGRAKLPYKDVYSRLLFASFKSIAYMVRYNISKLFIISFAIVLMVYIISKIIEFFKNQKIKLSYNIIRYPLYCFIILVYYIFLCGKVNPEYMMKVEDIYGLYAYTLVLIFIVLSYLVSKHRVINLFIPFFICFLIMEFASDVMTFRESNTPNYNPDLCEKIDNDIIKQMIKADKKTLTDVEIHVPKSSARDNWPVALYMNQRLSDTLYKHGIIKRKISVTIVPDKKYNKKYGIAID